MGFGNGAVGFEYIAKKAIPGKKRTGPRKIVRYFYFKNKDKINKFEVQEIIRIL
jgi:hypothetical protein